MPKADPGPEGRARFALFLRMRQYPEGSAVTEHRMRQLAEQAGDELDEILESFAVIEAEIRRVRDGQ